MNSSTDRLEHDRAVKPFERTLASGGMTFKISGRPNGLAHTGRNIRSNCIHSRRQRPETFSGFISRRYEGLLNPMDKLSAGWCKPRSTVSRNLR